MTAAKPSERTGTLVFKFVLYGALTAACMYVIYRFSAQNGVESSELSEKVAKAIAAIIYVGFDTFGAAEKLEILQGLSFNVRKAAHMTEFALLGACATATMWQLVQLVLKEKSKVFLASIVGLLVSVAYACSDEYHQLAVDGRAGQMSDIFIDSAGACIGTAVISIFLVLGTLAWRRRVAQEKESARYSVAAGDGQIAKTRKMPRVG